jgi:sugar O-acyltransferase (sialic acid O-acetyltransferase NeuD family)
MKQFATFLPVGPMRSFPLIVVGGAGHAKVLISTLLLQQRKLLGFVELNPSLPSLLGIPHMGDDRTVLLHSPDQVRLVNGVGSAGSTALRQTVYERFRTMGYLFETVIHPSAAIAPDVRLQEGVQVMAGAIVQPGSSLGENVIINTGSRVDHDCSIEAHAHVAPGVTMSGHVQVGNGAHIGAGATVIHGIKIGPAAIVGAGAVVVRDVPAGITVAGVPAVPLMKPVASR